MNEAAQKPGRSSASPPVNKTITLLDITALITVLPTGAITWFKLYLTMQK
jgi:hypothetical protein